MTIEHLRVYASFDEFERAELARATSAPVLARDSCLTTLVDERVALAPQARSAWMTACPATKTAPERTRVAFPRIYASFAEFEYDDRDCLKTLAGAPPVPSARLTTTVVASCESSSQVVLTKPERVRLKTPRARLVPAQLRAEGVLEIGRVTDTGMLYVHTRARLYLIHETWLPDQRRRRGATCLA